MQEVLITKLHDFLIHNNMDLLIALQQESRVSNYINEKVDSITPLLEKLLAENIPGYMIEEQCMNELTKDLHPSKFNYIISILEEEFETDYYRFKDKGIVTYEVINLIEACRSMFESLGFTRENEDDRDLRYAVTGAVKEYLDNKQ